MRLCNGEDVPVLGDSILLQWGRRWSAQYFTGDVVKAAMTWTGKLFAGRSVIYRAALVSAD